MIGRVQAQDLRRIPAAREQSSWELAIQLS